MFPKGTDVGTEVGGEREPLAAFASRRELPMPPLFDRTTPALEREQLFMPDARQSLTGTSTRSDLHSAVVADVVDDLDHGSGEIVVGNVAVSPAAYRAYPGPADASPELVGAEVAGTG